MIKINIHEAKANLSRYLKRLSHGETIILCKRNVPIAEIRPLAPERTAKRPLGLARGVEVPSSFFDPLPDDVLDGFDGQGS
jgi:prevent-host-death family protein